MFRNEFRSDQSTNDANHTSFRAYATIYKKIQMFSVICAECKRDADWVKHVQR